MVLTVSLILELAVTRTVLKCVLGGLSSMQLLCVTLVIRLVAWRRRGMPRCASVR